MRTESRARFWLRSGLAGASASLALLTLFWRDWIEAFGFDPDQHSGGLEWVIVAVLFAIAVWLGALARTEWQRLVQAGAEMGG